MKLFGYSQEDEEYKKLLTMKEICLNLDINEIDDLINFLKYVRNRHALVEGSAHEIHTHYDEWKNGKLTPIRINPDIIIETYFEQNPMIFIDLNDKVQ